MAWADGRISRFAAFAFRHLEIVSWSYPDFPTVSAGNRGGCRKCGLGSTSLLPGSEAGNGHDAAAVVPLRCRTFVCPRTGSRAYADDSTGNSRSHRHCPAGLRLVVPSTWALKRAHSPIDLTAEGSAFGTLPI